jgi:flagellar L-ring protein FlgH
MRLYQVVLLLWISAAMSSCSSFKQMPELREDELAIPVEESSEKLVSPGSLWTPGAKFVDMYIDQRAKRIGDIVVVQIVENSSADKEAKTESKKTNTMDNSITTILGIPLNKSSIKGDKLSPEVNASTSTDFKADGKTTRTGTISGSVSARIERILPSGNLVIKGKKQTRVNSELQYIIISGIIRPEDVSPINTIQSTYIADMQLDYYGTGVIGDQQNKGFIARALDKIWPF